MKPQFFSMNIIDFLNQRGILDATTSEDLKDHLSISRKVYLGIDPTADSLHLGHLAGVMLLVFFQRMGHQPYGIIGGATARVGDPSGKDKERPFLDVETLKKNEVGLTRSVKSLLQVNKHELPAIILNNYDWFKDIAFIDFLREVGKYYRVSSMLAKDSVKNRLQSEEGMSFTELSYQILQGYDFYYLYHQHQVTVQLGGSDQWGNITAGTELIRKQLGKAAYGLTFPLLTRSDGKKFGKSEKGAIWLCEKKLSPYDFYQYLVRIPDDSVISLLKMLTLLPTEDILSLKKAMQQEGYEANKAQKLLAHTVTEFVHGQKGVEKALSITQSMKPGQQSLDLQALPEMLRQLPHKEMSRQELHQVLLLDLLKDCEMLKSKGEGRKMVANGGVYLNNQRVEKDDYQIAPEDVLEGDFILLGVGKKKKLILKVVN